jgi:predicted O-methyltransferase YrrM
MDATRIGRVIEELTRSGTATDAMGTERKIFPVALDPKVAPTLREWVLREKAVSTVEVGLAYGYSALNICEGLVRGGDPRARHVVMDPHQLEGYHSAGLRVLESAGVSDLVEFHNEESQHLLPRLLAEKRCFDLAFVDGNHRFDYVFVDLFFLNRLVRKAGVVIVDDYNLPGIRRAVSFFIRNLKWSLECVDGERLAVLRTPEGPDNRDFTFFEDF